MTGPHVLVTGSVHARPETREELLRLALEHVHRSRAESGCLAHDVHVHAEDPMRLVFLERWADLEALRAHFAVPASTSFVEAVTALASEPPVLEVLEAAPARW